MTTSNFAPNLSWWDRLLGNLWAQQPTAGQNGMTIGIEQFRRPRYLCLDWMLVQTLRGPASGGDMDIRSEIGQ